MKLPFLTDTVFCATRNTPSVRWIVFVFSFLHVVCLSAISSPDLPGSRRIRLNQLQAIDRLSPTNRIKLSLGLALHDRPVLEGFLGDLYDPASPLFRRFLSPAEFTQRFGPTSGEYEAAVRFASESGFSIVETHSNRMLLLVEGDVSSIESAFGIQLYRYPHPSGIRYYFAPNRAPEIPKGLPIAHIAGLDDFRLPQPMSLHHSVATPRPRAGTGPGGSFLGKDFRKAYLPSVALTGIGQSVALVEFEGYYATDITAYETLAGLPHVPLKNVLIDGFNGVPTSRQAGSGNEEVALDIEMAISMAPGLDQVIVYEASPQSSAATTDNLLNRIATDNTARQISASWGFDPDATTQQIFLEYAAQGQSFFVASGDGGAYGAIVGQPTDNPFITVVGGTTLTTGVAGQWQSETVWNTSSGGSGGGFSSVYPIPDWQRFIDMSANGGSYTMRNLPDVALVADNVWVVADRGRSFAVVGTSIATPLWAGLTALVNQQAVAKGLAPVGFLNPALYAVGKGSAYPNVFHDIRTGNNFSTNSPTSFVAVSGYDLCTGWGSPSSSGLIDALLNPPLDPLRISPRLGVITQVALGAALTNFSQSFSISNSSAGPIGWHASLTEPWLSITPASGTLAVGGVAPVITLKPDPGFAFPLLGSLTNVLVVTNDVSGVVQHRQIVLLIGNGGFETGDFHGWNFAADTNVNYVDSIDSTQLLGSSAIPGVDDSAFVHSGVYGAAFGQNTTLGSLSVAVPTVPGRLYKVSFWLANPADGTPNEFDATWDGSKLYSIADAGSFGWTNLQFTVSAPGTSSRLQFQFQNDQNAFALDDVSVEQLTIPSFSSIQLSGTLVTLEWQLETGMRVQLQASDALNPEAWVNLGTPVIGVGGLVSASDSKTGATRFYRLIWAQ